jgi:hypothetical protein
MAYSMNAALPAIFLSMSLVLYLPTTLNNNLVSAQSPSTIVREEIPDNNYVDKTDVGLELNNSTQENRLVPIKLKNNITIFSKEAVDKSDCTLENFPLPSIDSVSFVSDGTILNSTLWLNQSFLETPYTKYEDSQFVNDSKIHQEFLSIYVFGANNLSLKEEDQAIMEEINRYNTNVTYHNPTNVTNNVTIADYEAINRTYTGISNSSYPLFGRLYYTQMNIIILNDNTFYKFEYKAEKERFDKEKEEIRKMINSFHINDATGSSKNDSQRNDQDKYTSYSITDDGTKVGEIQYPSNWQKAEKLFGRDDVTFFSPIEGAYHHYTQYGVKLLPKTVYVIPPESSTQGYIQKIHWDSYNQHWNNSLEDISSSNARRNIYENSAINFYREGQNWVQIPLSLRDINSPSDYSAFFFMNIKFVKGTEYCDFGEITNAISSPLPDIKITYDPERPSVGPDDEKIVEVKVQALTNSFSTVTLSVNKGDADIQSATFKDTNNTKTDTTSRAIRPNGWNTTQLVIKGLSTLNDKSTHPITLEITANINSSSRLKLSGTDTISPSGIDPSPIEERSSLTLDVLSFYDSILADFSALNTSGAVTIIIAIGTAIAGLVVGLFGKEKILALFR